MNIDSSRKAQARPAWIDDAFGQVVYDAVGPLCAGLAIIFCAFTVFNFFDMPPGAVQPLVIWDLCIVLCALMVLRGLARGSISPSKCDAIGVALTWLVQGNILLAFHFVGSPVYITYSAIVAVSVGCLLLSPLHLGVATAGLTAATLAVASFQVDLETLAHYGFTLFAASSLSFVIYSARMRTYTRLAMMRRHDEVLKAELEEALAGTEQELIARRQAESRYRDLVQGIDAIVWEADAETWAFTFIADHVQSVLGYSASEWISNKDAWVESVHPEDREQAVAFCMSCTQEGRNHVFEYRALTKSGDVVWLRDIVRVVKDVDGKARQLRGVMVDITESKKAEAETARLEAQLQQSHKLEAIGTLAGGFAHYFNNLLAGIM